MNKQNSQPAFAVPGGCEASQKGETHWNPGTLSHWKLALFLLCLGIQGAVVASFVPWSWGSRPEADAAACAKIILLAEELSPLMSSDKEIGTQRALWVKIRGKALMEDLSRDVNGRYISEEVRRLYLETQTLLALAKYAQVSPSRLGFWRRDLSEIQDRAEDIASRASALANSGKQTLH